MSRLLTVRTFLLLILAAGFLVGCSRDPNVRKQKYLESGERYFKKGKYREAAIQFGNAVQVDPRFAEAHYRLAQAQMKLQNWYPAFQELDRTVQLNPQHLDAVLSSDPNKSQAHVSQANLKARQDDLPGAMQEMHKAIQLAPDRWDV